MAKNLAPVALRIGYRVARHQADFLCFASALPGAGWWHS
jgi:hypothetical protein